MCKGKWGFWFLAAAVGGLYVVGKRERPAVRQPSVEAIDDPAVTAAWAHISRLPQFHLLRHVLLQRIVTGRSELRVLDVGSGAGLLLMGLAKRPEVREAVGIDLSAELVESAKTAAELSGADATFYQADAAQMPFEDGQFDVVVSTLSLHHWSDPQAVLREVRRVLAPGGRAIIVDLRRDAPAVLYGVTATARRLLPADLRATGEPLASFQAAYTAPEVALLAYKAGWPEPRVTTGPFWLALLGERPIAT